MKSFDYRCRRGFSRFGKSDEGAAAVELALVLFLLTIPILNVVDLAFFAFTWMQTQNAAQMGAQAAFSNCNTSNSLPAATNCYGPPGTKSPQSANNMTLYDVVAQGIQESALNSTVSLTSSKVVDGYYCTTSANVLTQIGSLGYAVADTGSLGATASNSNVAPTYNGAKCGAGYADTTAFPAEYARVDVTHTYVSIFPGMTVVALLPAVMTATAYVRIS